MRMCLKCMHMDIYDFQNVRIADMYSKWDSYMFIEKNVNAKKIQKYKTKFTIVLSKNIMT